MYVAKHKSSERKNRLVGFQEADLLYALCLIYFLKLFGPIRFRLLNE